MNWDKQMKEKAREEGLYLFKLTLQGKYAGFGSVDMAGPMPKEQAMALNIVAHDENMTAVVFEAYKEKHGKAPFDE